MVLIEIRLPICIVIGSRILSEGDKEQEVWDLATNTFSDNKTWSYFIERAAFNFPIH